MRLDEKHRPTRLCDLVELCDKITDQMHQVVNGGLSSGVSPMTLGRMKKIVRGWRDDLRSMLIETKSGHNE